ncbi:hypothetical protein BU202_05500 [Streptococcus cuniculi]|uniref:PTS EIIA type-2 domain-containing protein n=1 Tax=Streptococcus cuniculi TaxID=1432788 RepID=A0A1Q8E7Z3_9STRE|nr:PTS sugar transporter subunit IIA [Streptococcus cuniculi]OLF47917.1 hypothetical protein BU202_05500 [Streptococcus cuniculi]
MLQEYIKEDLIFIDQYYEDRQQFFEEIAATLVSKGYVTEGFGEFLQDRETNYPTGLELEDYNVAIPHGDPQFIIKPFIAVARLKESVCLYRMDDPEEAIPVKFFFFLGLDSGGNHLQILKEIMQQIQNKDMIEQLLVAPTEEAFLLPLKKL